MAEGNTGAALVKHTVQEAIFKNKEQFRLRLPASMDVEKFVLAVATAIQKNPKLAECTPNSLILACYDAAEMGISLSPSLQLGYLVPYAGVAQFQVGYRGLIQKVRATPKVRAFFAEVVYRNDRFERQLAPRLLKHIPADGERGEAIGAYAYIEFNNGSIDWEYMTEEQIFRRRAVSKAWKAEGDNNLLWGKFWEEGWRKTPIRALFKRIPLFTAELEKVAAHVARETEEEDEPPAGRLQLETDAPIASRVAGTDNRATAEPEKAQTAAALVVSIMVGSGKNPTEFRGDLRPVLNELPKMGAKLNEKTKTWSMPAASTHLLLEALDKKQIKWREVDAQGNEVGGASEPQEALF